MTCIWRFLNILPALKHYEDLSFILRSSIWKNLRTWKLMLSFSGGDQLCYRKYWTVCYFLASRRVVPTLWAADLWGILDLLRWFLKFTCAPNILLSHICSTVFLDISLVVSLVIRIKTYVCLEMSQSYHRIHCGSWSLFSPSVDAKSKINILNLWVFFNIKKRGNQ